MTEGVLPELTGNYHALMREIHSTMKPRTYLEIGMFTGSSLALVDPATQIIGIDPDANIRHRINRDAKLYFLRSDDFFAQEDPKRILGGRPIDLAFIDGLHHFDAALRDFMNVERSAGPDTVVMLHDCCPPTERATVRDRNGEPFWTGDTWRVVPLLRALRPDLTIHTVAVKPSGLTFISGLDPTSTVLWDRYDEAVAEYGALPYSALDADRVDMLGLVPNEWPVVADFIPAGLRTETPANLGPKRFPRRWPVIRNYVVRGTKRNILKVTKGLRGGSKSKPAS